MADNDALLQKTALFDTHIKHGGKMVNFAGWSLPVHYGSQIAEHNAVRQNAGMFDVSHMLVTDVEGKDAKAYLRYLLANDVNKLTTVGKALYTMMLNEEGGVIDDLIVYRLNQDESQYRIVSNAATCEKDSQQFKKISASFDVTLTPRRDLTILSVQGPLAQNKLAEVRPQWANILSELKPFQGVFAEVGSWVAKTGYTGEKGVEIILPNEEASRLFEDLKNVGVVPAGLGARDTLRLEAGMNLYGTDMDEKTSPLSAGLGWTISFEKHDFIGKQAVQQQKKEGVKQKQVGLVLTEKSVLRNGMQVVNQKGEQGVITSGSFSPTLKHSIALARVPVSSTGEVRVVIHGKEATARIVTPPFVRNGKKQF